MTAIVLDAIKLHVAGDPVSQGSVSAVIAGGRAMVRQGGDDQRRQRLGDWRHAVAEEARRWIEQHDDPQVLDGPVRLTLVFTLPRPASLPRWRWLPWTKPDIDKLARAVMDALTKVLYRDDARITDLHVKKRYARGGAPGCDITLEVLDERGVIEAAP